MPAYKHIAILLVGVSLAAHSAEPAAKKAPTISKTAHPDISFLEYLGTLEGDDENWTQIDMPSIATTASPKPEAKSNAKAEAAAKRVTERK